MMQVLETENYGKISINKDSIKNDSDVDVVKSTNSLSLNIPDNYKGTISIIFEEILNEKISIVIGKNAKVTIFEDNISKSDFKGDIKININENSNINYIEIQNLNNSILNNVTRNIYCNKGSSINRVVFCIGSKSAKCNTNIYLSEASVVNDTELFFGNGDQNFELNTNLIHEGLKSNGNVLIKGILIDNAFCSSQGLLKINKEAQKTNTVLSEHVLLLSKDARALAVPSLEIEADDVQASHAASVTQIDGDHVFYLTTRGIAEKEAKKMIALSFLQNALDKIQENKTKEIFRALFEEKWN